MHPDHHSLARSPRARHRCWSAFRAPRFPKHGGAVSGGVWTRTPDECVRTHSVAVGPGAGLAGVAVLRGGRIPVETIISQPRVAAGDSVEARSK